MAIFSLTPPQSEPSISFLSDKLQHASAYAWLALNGAIAYSSTRAAMALLSLLPILGVAIELTQYLVPGRTPEIADGIANFVGTICGVGLILAVRQINARRGRSLD